MGGSNLQFANGIDVCVGFNHCSGTVRAPNDAALQLWIRAVPPVLPSKDISEWLKNTQNGLALQRVNPAIRVYATKAPNFIESFLIPGKLNEIEGSFHCKAARTGSRVRKCGSNSASN